MRFVTFVLLPADTPSEGLPGLLSARLAPYHMNRPVRRVHYLCPRCGRALADAALEEAQRELGKSARELGEEYYGIALEDRPSHTAHWAPFRELQARAEERLAERFPPDPDCPRCAGRGRFESWDNPEGAFDAWWPYAEEDEEEGSVEERLVGLADRIAADDPADPDRVRAAARPLADVLQDIEDGSLPVPHAIVTLDGAWHTEERPDILIGRDDDREAALRLFDRYEHAWEEEAMSLLAEAAPETVTVLCEMHI